MDASTTGSGQHKIKTINVEVNLLDAWAVQRIDLESKAFRKLILLAGLAFFATVMIPLLASLGSEKAKRLATANANLANFTHSRDDLEKEAKKVAPALARNEVLTRSHQMSTSFFDELARVINASPSEMYFEQLQTEITGGECLMKIIADATTQEVGREFVAKAGMGKNTLISNQTSIRQGQISENSIKFDYTKRVRLEQ